MEQFNQNTYKKPNLFQEFYHSCLGKVVIHYHAHYGYNSCYVCPLIRKDNERN